MSELKGCVEACSSLHPRFTNGETKAPRDSLGQPRSQAFIPQLTLRFLCLRPRDPMGLEQGAWLVEG